MCLVLTICILVGFGIGKVIYTSGYPMKIFNFPTSIDVLVWWFSRITFNSVRSAMTTEDIDQCRHLVITLT